MNLKKEFDEIEKWAHIYNWLPDLQLVRKIYMKFPDSYTILLPFMYSYLEECIRSVTAQYGRQEKDESGKIRRKTVGKNLINIAIEENQKNQDLVDILKKIQNKYFKASNTYDIGDNRNSTDHGYLPPFYWKQEAFEDLIKDIAKLSKYTRF